MQANVIIILAYLPVARRGIAQTRSGGKQAPIRDDSEEEEEVDDSYADQIFVERKQRKNGGKGKLT